MKYGNKLNRFEKKEMNHQKVKNALSGKGVYLFKNKSKTATLSLPRPTASGLRVVGPSASFQGDDYYMQMVRSGDLALMEVLDDGNPKPELPAPAPEPICTAIVEAEEVLTESVKDKTKKTKSKEEKVMSEQKLLLDQPERVTTKGKTEHVIDRTTGKVKLNEGDKQPQDDVLLNEAPSTGGFVVLS